MSKQKELSQAEARLPFYLTHYSHKTRVLQKGDSTIVVSCMRFIAF